MRTTIDAVFVGGLQPLPPEGQLTGIFKQPAHGPVRVGGEGLDGDRQADRRVHGGPDKAVHLFPADHYAALAAVFPSAVQAFVPGSFGENLSALGWREGDVCVGDVVRAGSALLQLSQPRSPCWKLNHRFQIEALSRHVADHGIAGWYYRVLEAGEVAAGDAIELVGRNPAPVTVARFWEIVRQHRPPLAELQALRSSPGLAANWVARLDERIAWLRANP